MHQKTIWVLIIVILLAGGWYFMSRKTVEAPNDIATTTRQGSVGTLTDGVYALDVEKSSLTWTGSKTLIKEYFDNGTLSFKEGSVIVTGGTLVAGSFVVDMKSFKTISTSNQKVPGSALETHLKSADFFDVATYPIATVGIKSVENGIVKADVTIKNVTKEVSFPATISQDGKTLSGTASLTLDRTLWDIRYGSGKFFSDLGDKVISDSVKIDLTLVAQSN
ncbi:MAG: YceI family protein [Candidatus Campbellbacteria bacterium]|nr:YceI family protein [Candidatus Campbellbacteria bacterium]